MSKRTKGEWEVDEANPSLVFAPDKNGKYNYILACEPDLFSDSDRSDVENGNNAAFVAMCGTVANQLDEMGYDGEKAIRVLPDIIKLMKNSNESEMRIALRVIKNRKEPHETKQTKTDQNCNPISA